MEFIDYYKILECDKTATAEDIKKAYRKLARKYHPDVNPNDENAKKKFQQINEANEVLGDPEKRKKYDQHGENWKHAEAYEKAGYANAGGQPYSGGEQNWSGNDPDFSDFFSSMFGNARGQTRSHTTKFRGQDLHATLNLNLKDVYQKLPQTLTVNGKNIRITIPAGVENGQTIRINNYGSEGINGGPNGDLLITFDIINNTPFKREGSNLFADVDIDVCTAALGDEITTDTFDGKVKLKVKPGTQSGTKVKLAGKGFTVYKKENEFGDLYLTYKVKIPTELTAEQKELFTQLSKTMNK